MSSSPVPVARRFRSAVVLLSVAAVAACSIPGAERDAAEADDPSIRLVAAATPPLPFQMPSTRTLRSSHKRVFAHYLPSMPVSIDNRDPNADYWKVQYQNPTGESGRHKSFGGFVRDRPATRPVRAGADWRLQDAVAEVRTAVSFGLDGFAYNVISLPTDRVKTNWQATKTMLQAARIADNGFKIMLMPDMVTSPGRLNPSQLAQYMAELGREPAALRLGDGRLVIAPYIANVHNAAWWQSFMNIMRTKYGIRVALMPLFLEERGYLKDFMPISYGISNWGGRNPFVNNPDQTWPSSRLGRVKAVRSQRKLWMQPVSVQDARPGKLIYDEGANSQNLRNTWAIAIRSGAEWVQLATWNDYTEGTHMAPSQRNGAAVLDVNAYYLAWYKTGTAPRITRDAVYVSNRNQRIDARPRFPQTKFMKLRGGGTAARNTIEALTFLTAPATVTIQAGAKSYSCNVPAGVGSCVMALSDGRVSARVTRAGRTTATVVSPTAVTSAPLVQDYEYYFASSLRNPR